MSKQPWPRPSRQSAAARFPTPGPVEIAKTLIWLMRDRGALSPDDLHGVSRPEIEMHARARKKNQSLYETFDEAMEDAIASGWVESYAVDGESFFIPNYRRAP